MEINELYPSLNSDALRQTKPWSREIAESTEALLHANSDAEKSRILSAWLSKHQPCLFGRLAAKNNLITYCFLDQSDLLGDFSKLTSKIQDRRLHWHRQGFQGASSAFVIHVTCATLASAEPSVVLLKIAQRLAAAYLLQHVEPDTIYLDELFLEKPGLNRTTWKWFTGINYFATNADGRWWQDHRIPGGIALSINSVGHLVQAGRLSQALNTLDELLGGEDESTGLEIVTSLTSALDLAMRTIALASNAVSGKATELVPLPDPVPTDFPKCPFSPPKALTGKDYTSYTGWYHTDMTLPSEYFGPEVTRPNGIQQHSLDFTYLFHDDVANPDFITTGKGLRIRGSQLPNSDYKLEKMLPSLATLSTDPRLADLL
jgi:hypothetical protein